MYNKICKIITVITVLLVASNTSYAQDPAFTQFYANPLYLNPAFAGSNECPRASFNYRNQWPGVGQPYVTSSATWDTHINGIGGGVGIMIAQDKAGSGALNTTHVAAQYSYRLKVSSKFMVKAGFEAAFRMIKLDWKNLQFGDMIDSQLGFIYPTQEDIDNYEQSTSFPDFSAGVLGFSENLFFGLAVHHLTVPNQGFISESPLPSKLTAHAGGNIVINKFSNNPITLSPNILYQSQSSFQQFNYGIYARRGPIVGGAWLRNSVKNFDSFILMMGLVQDSFKFGYSYDITVSELGNDKTLGAHEISFTVFMPCRTKSKSYNTISCPQF
jgi:type IX secretion system PorP/SprF family membrane protein